MQTILAERFGKHFTTDRIRRWSMIIMLAYSAIACPDNTKSGYFNGGKPATCYAGKAKGDSQVSPIKRFPVITGGMGVRIFENSAQALNYSGAFRRPLLIKPLSNDLMAGAQPTAQNELPAAEEPGNTAWEPALWFMELGAGKLAGALPDFRIARERQGLQYLLATRWQRYQNQDYPGGYLALHNRTLMVSGGSDGEQWRSVLGYVAPEQGDDSLRPAVEGFYVDNSLGETKGGKTLMVSGSLGFRKGFLGHGSRLGRAMGPAGGEFSNPLSYFNPDFNRRLTAWEIGGVVDFRLLHKTLARGGREKTLETALYPGQLLGKKSLFEPLFVGAGVSRSPLRKDGISALFGYHQQLGNFGASARVQHDFDRNNTRFIISLSHGL
jgi:hypothetical protein